MSKQPYELNYLKLEIQHHESLNLALSIVYDEIKRYKEMI